MLFFIRGIRAKISLFPQGPDSWDDVLTKNRIEGTCHREDCQGTQFAVSIVIMYVYSSIDTVLLVAI